jgi:hypothetical protein
LSAGIREHLRLGQSEGAASFHHAPTGKDALAGGELYRWCRGNDANKLILHGGVAQGAYNTGLWSAAILFVPLSIWVIYASPDLFQSQLQERANRVRPVAHPVFKSEIINRNYLFVGDQYRQPFTRLLH